MPPGPAHADPDEGHPCVQKTEKSPRHLLSGKVPFVIDAVVVELSPQKRYVHVFTPICDWTYLGIGSLGAPGGVQLAKVRIWISAQVTISRFVGSSPASGSAQSLLGIVSPSLCSYPPYPLSQKKKKRNSVFAVVVRLG